MLLGCGSTHQRVETREERAPVVTQRRPTASGGLRAITGVAGSTPAVSTPSRTLDGSTASEWKNKRAWNVALWNRAVWEAAIKRAAVGASELSPSPGTKASGKVTHSPATAAPSSIATVMQCIKDHESGNYTESSHPSSGSGAFQYTPGTFSAWQERWANGTGYTGPRYALAYLAPPWMQDAITVFALTNGGAGAWSMRWGNDPCTSGLPGGG